MKNSTKMFLTALVAATFSLPAMAEKLDLDTAHSAVLFEVTHLKLAKIPGSFKSFGGSIDINDKDLKNSSVEFSVDIASVDTGVEKRNDHLKNEDFFDATKHPKATFKSTSIKKASKGYKLEGDLTIRGVTKKAKFEVKKLGQTEDPNSKKQKTLYVATGEINRKDFGVNYGPDAIISDKVALTIHLQAVPAAVEAAAEVKK